MLSGSSLTVEIGGRSLLRDADFLVGEGDKVGLVGRNGTGKSSLISVIVGEPHAELRHSGNIKAIGSVGYLPQVPRPEGLGLEPSGFSHVLSARGLDRLDEQLGVARRKLAEDPSEEHINAFSETEEAYRERGGYEAEATMARLADGLGLRQELLLEDLNTLSGGQRRRVDLIRLLFQEPETMVLDEPTNHLDRSAKAWLMDELTSTRSSILVVSHDLDLLDKSITKVLHLSNSKLTEYKGSYSAFTVRLEGDLAAAEKSAAAEEKEMKRLKSLADSMRGQTEKRAKTAKALDRRVERIASNRTEVAKRERKASFTLPEPQRSGDVPLDVRGLQVAYGDLEVLRSATFHARRGDRICVVGRNGAGKSSLLRCLAGSQQPSSGSVELGHNVTLGYFAQEHEQVDLAATSLDNVDDSVLRTEAERRALLGSFGLPGTAAEQAAGLLSGGERAKLGLAMLSAGKANLLILDEPTNNLDPASVEAVGLMFSKWPGTIVVVSHEPAFVEALAPTHCLHLPDERYDLWREEDLNVVADR